MDTFDNETLLSSTVVYFHQLHELLGPIDLITVHGFHRYQFLVTCN